MKKIQKGNVPKSFTNYCTSSTASFEDLGKNHSVKKKKLKAALSKEQGHICCYCGKRLIDNLTIVEHLKPKKKFPLLQLDYQNLLASCDGGRDERTQQQYYPPCCDSAKGDNEIPITPFQENCEMRFICDDSGEISAAVSSDMDAIDTIKILKLNSPVLMNLRKGAIARYLPLDDEDDYEWDWENETKQLDKLQSGKFEPFCWAMKSYILHFQLDPVENKEFLGV